jgi:hypothetical protein
MVTHEEKDHQKGRKVETISLKFRCTASYHITHFLVTEVETSAITVSWNRFWISSARSTPPHTVFLFPYYRQIFTDKRSTGTTLPLLSYIDIRLRAARQGFNSWHRERWVFFSFRLLVQTELVPPTSCPMDTAVLATGANWPFHEADLSPKSSA